MRDLLCGYAVTTLCGWSVFPLLHRLLARLPDRGYSLCRCFGVILAATIGWLLAAAARRPLTTGIAGLAVLLAAMLSGAVAVAVRRTSGTRRPGDGEGLADFLRSGAKWIVCVEVLFLGGLLLFSWIQWHNPAVDPDSERFMDYALLRGCLRSPGLPIPDPWFAGRDVAYYHFGYAMVAFLVRAAGAEPAHFFITAVALQHALLWAGAFGIGLALTRRAAGGFLAAFFVLGAGNGEWIRQWVRPGGLVTFDWFASSRAIEGSITEFPWFSMLWGDLHPYVMALPIAACALSLSLAEVLPTETLTGAAAGVVEAGSVRVARSVCFALTCGALLATHPWDFPVILGAAAFVTCAPAGRGRVTRTAGTVLSAAASSILYVPFLRGLAGAGHGLGRVTIGSRPGEWVMAYLPFIVLAAVSATLLSRAALRGRRDGERLPARDRLALILAGVGLLTAIACEVVYVRDLFAPTSLYRMNTVFKLYRLAWLLLGVASPSFVIRLLARKGGASMGHAGPIAARACVAIVLAAALIYPVLGTAAWLRARSAVAGGAGNALAAAAQSPGADAEALFRALYPGDAEAASFIASSASTGEAVVEETGEPYTWSSRIATFSGVPTVLGWGNHEAVWRQSWQGVLERDADVQAIYHEPAAGRACDLIRRYGVRWIVVGERERRRYGADAGRVAAAGRRAFESQGTAVYDVAGLCGPGAAPAPPAR